MTTGLEVKIFRALTDRLDAFAAARVLTVAKPGLAFSPGGATYLRAFQLPGSTDAMDVAGVVEDQRGTFQVNIVSPEGAGLVAAFELAAALKAWFAPGTALSHQGMAFSIQTPPHIGPALEEPGWTVVPVSIRWRVFVRA